MFTVSFLYHPNPLGRFQTVLFNQSGSGEAPDRRVVTEAALSSSVVHPNIVSTYHYDIKSVKAKVADYGSLEIEHCSPGDWKLFLVQVRMKRGGDTRGYGEQRGRC